MKDFIYLSLDRGEGRERDINTNRLPLALTPMRTEPATQACALTPEPGQRPFALWDDVSPTEPHQSGLL